MAQMMDNLIAYHVLSMLVKPFAETAAYKLGIIDVTGKNLIKARDLTTIEQKNAYTYLHRLVFNLKKLINKLPGGESKLKNIVAAFFLIKESYANHSVTIDEQKLVHLVKLLDEGVILASEQLIVEDFLSENATAPAGGGGGIPAASGFGIANTTGVGVSTDEPVIRKRKRFARFTVNDEVYNKFADGKAKYRKWAQYLNMEDEGQQQIYKYAKENPSSVIILHNGKDEKPLRGGNWAKIKKPTRDSQTETM